MAPLDPIVLCFPGAICAAGTNLPEIASATNAGLRRLGSDTRLAMKSDGASVPIGRVQAIDNIEPALHRMMQLAHAAMGQSVSARASALGLPLTASLASVPILLSVPPARPGLTEEAVDWLLSALLEGVEDFDRQRSGAVRIGHDGFMAVLQAACALLERGEATCCLLGAVDSAVDRGYIHWLEQTGRLRSRQQPNGLAPGEAAAFCFVARKSTLSAPDSALVEFGPVGRYQESNPWYLGQATIGDGLTNAVRHAIGGRTIDACYADLNGESWRSAEWDYAYLRNGKHFAHPLDIRHPSEAWGDIGAASGAMLTLMAAWDLQEGMLGHQSALVCASSDTQPSRAACRLQLTRITAQGSVA